MAARPDDAPAFQGLAVTSLVLAGASLLLLLFMFLIMLIRLSLEFFLVDAALSPVWVALVGVAIITGHLTRRRLKRGTGVDREVALVALVIGYLQIAVVAWILYETPWRSLPIG